MKTIVETPGEPYMIEDRTTPIFETQNHKSRLWLSLHEAMSVTGESITDIIASAETNTPTKKGNQFGYPDRKTLKTYLPDYKVVRGRFNPPVPVTATFEIKHGRRTLREEWHYRTLTAFRQCNELTVFILYLQGTDVAQFLANGDVDKHSEAEKVCLVAVTQFDEWRLKSSPAAQMRCSDVFKRWSYAMHINEALGL